MSRERFLPTYLHNPASQYFRTPLSLLEYYIYFEESARHEREHLISTEHLTQQDFDTDNPGAWWEILRNFDKTQNRSAIS